MTGVVARRRQNVLTSPVWADQIVKNLPTGITVDMTTEATGGPIAGVPWRKATVSSGTSTSANWASIAQDLRPTVVAGQTFFVSGWVARPNTTRTWRLQFSPRNAAGGTVSVFNFDFPPMEPGQWAQVQGWFTIPATATTMGVTYTPASAFAVGELAAGQTFGFGPVRAELAPVNVNPGEFFYGDTPDVGNLWRFWSGAFNASASVEDLILPDVPFYKGQYTHLAVEPEG